MKIIKNSPAFSLVELSIAILVISILIAATTQGSRLFHQVQVSSGATLTESFDVNSIKDLAVWFDANDQKTLKTSAFADITTTSYGNIDNNNLISAWQDKNPQPSRKIEALTVDDDSRPTYLKKGIKNMPALEFSGSQILLSASQAPISAGDDTYSLIAVWQQGDSDTNADYIMQQGIVATHTMASIHAHNSGSTQLVGFVGYGNSYYQTALHKSKPYISIIVVNNNNSNNITLYNSNLSGTIGASDNGAASLNVSSAGFAIGARTNETAYFTGKIAEILIYDRNLKASEIKSINSYLSKKYKIALN